MTRSDLKILAENLAAEISARIHVPRWLDIKQACQYANIKRDTLMKWVDEGYVYGHKRSGKWIIDRDSIDNFYNQDRLTPSC